MTHDERASRKKSAPRPANGPPVSIEERAEAAEHVQPVASRSERMSASIEAQMARMTDADRTEIHRLRKQEGWTYAQLMRQYGVLNGVITRVLNEPTTPVDAHPPVLDTAAPGWPDVDTVSPQRVKPNWIEATWNVPDPITVGRFDRSNPVPEYPAPSAGVNGEEHEFLGSVLQYAVIERTQSIKATSFTEAVRKLVETPGVLEVLNVTRMDYKPEERP